MLQRFYAVSVTKTEELLSTQQNLYHLFGDLKP